MLYLNAQSKSETNCESKRACIKIRRLQHKNNNNNTNNQRYDISLNSKLILCWVFYLPTHLLPLLHSCSNNKFQMNNNNMSLWLKTFHYPLIVTYPNLFCPAWVVITLTKGKHNQICNPHNYQIPLLSQQSTMNMQNLFRIHST